jgi:hypothetical protein
MITNRKAISTQYIGWAISTLAENGVTSNATKYTVKHTKLNGETVDVAPKKIISTAHKLQFEEPLPHSRFSGGYETNNFLRRHGVEVTTL